MFGDHYAPAKQLLAVVQAVVGPTREGTRLGAARAKGQWEHQAHYRGCPLRFVISHRYASGGVGRLMGIFVGVPLGGRPIEVFVDLAAPGGDGLQLPNGASSLLPYVGASGFPESVVRAALDERTVAEMRAVSAACAVLYVAQEGDWLTTFVNVETPQGLSPGPTPMPAPADLVRVFDFLQAASDRLVSAFDHAHAEVHRTDGPAAAAQWLAAQQSAALARRETRQRGTVVAIAVTVVVLLAIVMTVILLGNLLLG
jgi:hypothetical protein